jgi:peptidylprolyl isomerase
MMTTQAKEGDTVKVHYTGKLEDGTVFDSSQEREPLEFTIGSGDIIAGFERAVIGMSPGDSTTERIPAKEAYGPRQEGMVMELGREDVPAEISPEVGQQLQIRQEDGQAVPVMITEVSDGAVLLDANHPLAGETLVFDIELVEIA